MREFSLDTLKSKVGQELGTSDWIEISQERINKFADLTEDWQFIHIDEERAKQTPFGGTIAHGFLTLSMMSRLAETGLPRFEGAVMSVNYGFNRIRNIAPVTAGSHIRGVFKLSAIEAKGQDTYVFCLDVNIDVKESNAVAVVAQWLIMVQFASN